MKQTLYKNLTEEQKKRRAEIRKEFGPKLEEIKKAFRENFKRNMTVSDMLDDLILGAMTEDSDVGILLAGFEMGVRLTQVDPGDGSLVKAAMAELSYRYGVETDAERAERCKGVQGRMEKRVEALKQIKTLIEGIGIGDGLGLGGESEERPEKRKTADVMFS